MPYVPVPKDLSTVKTKVAFNLTKRQLICFSLAAAVGVPIYFLTRNIIGTSGAVVLLVIASLPCFLFAVYEKNGQPLEKILKNYINAKYIRPKIRPYQTNNFYAAIERQIKLEKEVESIVKGKNTTAKKQTAFRQSKKADSRSSKKG